MYAFYVVSSYFLFMIQEPTFSLQTLLTCFSVVVELLVLIEAK